MKRLTLLSLSIVILTNLMYSQSVDVKDGDGNSLITINDEGDTGGSITIPEATSVGASTNKLYNLGRKLYWDGIQLGTVGGADGDWTISGNNIYPSVSGNVGIGNKNPLSMLSVGGDGILDASIYTETSGISGYGVYASALNNTWTSNYGGYFEAAGANGYGVYGKVTATDGTNYGGYFETAGNLGRGVYGHATSTGTSINYGGHFVADASSGRGVYGSVTGVSGHGVHGETWDATGTNYGGYFRSRGQTGYGIYASALNSDWTSNYGGYFEAAGANGYGVYGKVTATDGTNYGGYFEAAGNLGRGVYGHATYSGAVVNYGGLFIADGSSGNGVYGSVTGVSGHGVHGETWDVTGTNYGGYFRSRGQTGYGVWGQVLNTSGVNYGGHFSTSSSSGRGIRGHATNTSGENYGGAFKAEGDAGRGAWAYGIAYDFYAGGPGVDMGSSSSIRWKNNIEKIDNPLEKINKLRGVYFDWDEGHGGGHDIGCIAEEVGKVLPEIVVYEENGIDANGMDYSKLTPLLVEAVKELKQIVDDQQKRIEYLESN